MIGQMALPGFNDLGCSVTPIFLLMDHFVYQFSTFSKKWRKLIDKLAKCHQVPFCLALCLSVRWFQMPLEGLSFVKTLTTVGIIYATEPLLQNMTEIICLR